MAAFDPDESDDAGQQGFTSMSPLEIPNAFPSRSLSDSMESRRVITGEMRTRNMSNDGNDETKVTAYSDVQFGRKALSNDGFKYFPEVGDYKKSGEGEYDNHQAPELYKSANGPMDIPGDADGGDEDE